MKHLIAFLLFLLAATGAQAVDRQYCACDAGAAPGCVATSPDLPSEFTVNFTAVAGDRFLFCQGGSWVRSGLLVIVYEDDATCVPTCAPNHIQFDSYVAGWGGTGVKPKLASTTSAVFQFGASYEVGMDGGYIVQNLALSGNSTGLSAFNVTGNFRDLIIRNNDMTLFANAFIELTQSLPVSYSTLVPASGPYTVTITPVNSGTFLTDQGVKDANDAPLTLVVGTPATGQYSVSGSVYTFAAADAGDVVHIHYTHSNMQRNRNILIENNTFTNAIGGSVACIHGGGIDVVIQNNAFSKCGGCAATCHTMYLASEGAPITVRKNTMEKAGAYNRGDEICESGNISIRGKLEQVLVEDNLVNNSAGTVSSCGGIQMKPAYCFVCDPPDDPVGAASWDHEYLRRLVVRGNTVLDSGSLVTGIEVAMAPYVLVENNVLVRTIAASNSGFEYPGNKETSPAQFADSADYGGVIRNNTCIFTNGAEGGTCFSLDAQAGHGTGVTFTNNIALMTASATGTQSCFRHGALSDYTAWNGNICYGFDRWSTTASTGGGYTNHAAAHAAGFDTWSTAGGLADNDPLVTTPTSGNSWSAALTSDSSPAHNNGISAYKAKFDRLGCVRDSTPSIGAEERGGTSCQTTTGAPQYVR